MTAIGAPPIVPEIRLHLATEVTPLWEATEATLAKADLPPPFWAFAWLGGQALARYILDNPGTVAGKRVLDFAAGGGIGAIAAAKAGASRILAAEIDPFAMAALRLNAALNAVAFDRVDADLVGTPVNAEVILAGDVCYERPMAIRVTSWLRECARGGALVLIGDPGRNYLPKEVLEPLARYAIPTSSELEDRPVRDTTVFRII
jgi:predicted nicotinamide N-methyase